MTIRNMKVRADKKNASKQAATRKAVMEKVVKHDARLPHEAVGKRTKKAAHEQAMQKAHAVPKKKEDMHPAPHVLQVGERAPAFKVQDDEGRLVSLKDYRDQTVVLYFYPKDMTSGCTMQGESFRDAYKKFSKQNVAILGVSKDSIDSHRKFKTKFEFPFPLLSDTDGKLCEAFGVWKEKNMYGRKIMGIERMTFVISVDSKGVGTIERIYPKVKVAGHIDQILKDLKA